MEASYLEVRTIDAPAPFSYLPAELNFELLEWMDVKALASLKGVCQFFCQTIDLNNLLLKAANRSFVSRIIKTNDRYNPKRMHGDSLVEVHAYGKLISRFLKTYFPQGIIKYDSQNRSYSSLNDHDETLLSLIRNQTDLKNWNQAYRLLTSFLSPLNQMVGYLILIEQGKGTILDAYPEFVSDGFNLIEKLDSKLIQAYLLSILSILLAPINHRSGLEAFNKAKGILLSGENLFEIPQDRSDHCDYFFC